MTTVEDISQDEVAARLRNLASKHFDLEYLRASEADAPETPEVRSNRAGTMLWTTGKDFHYTADWISDDDGSRRKRHRLATNK